MQVRERDSWKNFLVCEICFNPFSVKKHPPISLGCGHTICQPCLRLLLNKKCPFDQSQIKTDIECLPVNFALLQLVKCPNGGDNLGESLSASQIVEAETICGLAPRSVQGLSMEHLKCYMFAKKCMEDLALQLEPLVTGNNSGYLPLPMQRKLVTLINCQLMEEKGRLRAVRAARSLGERMVNEIIWRLQDNFHVNLNVWTAVRSHGGQLLGPPKQEKVLRLVVLALHDGESLMRKDLVMYIYIRMGQYYSEVSKTSIAHVVQLLYRAGCFYLIKRESDSTLIQLKEEFCTYDSLRRQHDAQIVQIAIEAGLRIASSQWSLLLYGDANHNSHMQSIIDTLQTPQSFAQSVQQLLIALQRTGDPTNVLRLRRHLKLLSSIDTLVQTTPAWQEVSNFLDAVREVVMGLAEFVEYHLTYRTSLCQDHTIRGACPRGSNCKFAHSQEELNWYRAKRRINTNKNTSNSVVTASNSNNVTSGDIHQHDNFVHQNNHFHNSLPIANKSDVSQQDTASITTTDSPMRSASGSSALGESLCNHFEEIGTKDARAMPIHQQNNNIQMSMQNDAHVFMDTSYQSFLPIQNGGNLMDGNQSVAPVAVASTRSAFVPCYGTGMSSNHPIPLMHQQNAIPNTNSLTQLSYNNEAPHVLPSQTSSHGNAAPYQANASNEGSYNTLSTTELDNTVLVNQTDPMSVFSCFDFIGLGVNIVGGSNNKPLGAFADPPIN